jgi:hypothetical protein
MERRRFFHRCSQFLSLLGSAILIIPGVGFLTDPLIRGRRKNPAHRLLNGGPTPGRSTPRDQSARCGCDDWPTTAFRPSE